MLILSPSACSLFTIKPRVSSSYSSVSSSPSKLASMSCSLSVRSSVRRRPCVVLCSSKARGMAELVDDKESTTTAEVTSTSASENNELGHSFTFLDVRTEEDLVYGIRKETEAGRLPLLVGRAMDELYQNYLNAVALWLPAFPNVALNLPEDPFVFPPYHTAIREPFDYYMFVQNYIRPLIDFRTSYVGNISLFHEIEEKLQQTYVAGDRVVTDPLCKPFSMGRNLLCVYSKKHMYDVPERRANTRSLKELALLLRGGSKILWIAPSGGRDRPDPVTKQWFPAPFDASSVDNMRRLADHASVPGHIYPLAILCHDIMPPPPEVEKEIGEKWVISFHGAALSVAPKIGFHEIAGACGDPKEAKVACTQALYDSVIQQ